MNNHLSFDLMKDLRKSIAAFLIALGSLSFFSANAQDGENVMNSIPSSLEISQIVKSLGDSYYKKDNLNNISYVSNYSTNYKKAINLGIYSTDLGMASLYKKNQDVLNYLDAVKSLSDGLSLSRFFDIKALSELANGSNIEKLLQETTKNFSEINDHLNETKRGYQSALLITGGWLEATYLTTLVYNQSKDVRLKEKIGEQKLILETIMAGLQPHTAQQGVAGLLADFKALQVAYNKVTITTKTGGKPKVEEKNGELVISSTAETVVTVSDSDLNTIISVIAGIRKKAVN